MEKYTMLVQDGELATEITYDSGKVRVYSLSQLMEQRTALLAKPTTAADLAHLNERIAEFLVPAVKHIQKLTMEHKAEVEAHRETKGQLAASEARVKHLAAKVQP